MIKLVLATELAPGDVVAHFTMNDKQNMSTNTQFIVVERVSFNSQNSVDVYFKGSDVPSTFERHHVLVIMHNNSPEYVETHSPEEQEQLELDTQ